MSSIDKKLCFLGGVELNGMGRRSDWKTYLAVSSAILHISIHMMMFVVFLSIHMYKYLQYLPEGHLDGCVAIAISSLMKINMICGRYANRRKVWSY